MSKAWEIWQETYQPYSARTVKAIIEAQKRRQRLGEKNPDVRIKELVMEAEKALE